MPDLDDDRLAIQGHAIARDELLALPRFDRAVHGDATLGDCLFRLAAAGSEPTEFDELAKFDRRLANENGPGFIGRRGGISTHVRTLVSVSGKCSSKRNVAPDPCDNGNLSGSVRRPGTDCQW